MLFIYDFSHHVTPAPSRCSSFSLSHPSVLHSHLLEILGMAGASRARESLPHIANPSPGRSWGMFHPDKRRSGEIPSPFPLWEAQQAILRSSHCSHILCVRVKWGFVVVHEGWARLWESLLPQNGKWLLFFISSLLKQLIFANLRHQTHPF